MTNLNKTKGSLLPMWKRTAFGLNTRWFVCTLVLLGLWSASTFAQTTFTIGTGTSVNQYYEYSCPYGKYYTDGKQSLLYTAAELSAAGMTSGMSITQVGFNVSVTNSAGSHPSFTITMSNTALTTLSSSFVAGTTVYGPTNYTPTTGWNMHTLSSAFTYTGGGIIVTVCWQNPVNNTYTNNAGVFYTSLTGRAVDYHSDTNPSACSASSGTVNAFRANARFVATGGSGCSGTPAPGNTLSSSAAVCSGVSFTLSLQNATTGSGVTYQWQSSPDNVTWSNTAGTSATYPTTQTSATYYRCLVTCSGNTGTSNPLQVTMQTGPACITYCTSIPLYTADEEIYQVTVNGSSTPAAYANTNGCTTVAPGPNSQLNRYSNFFPLGSLASVQQAQVVSFQVRENECDGATYYGNGIGVWIDFNQNGSFNDAGEAVYIESNTSAATGLSPGGDKVVNFTATIPVTALTGQTAMRVISAEGYSGASLTPCLAYNYGETEDWIINITPAPTCSGMPAPGNTLASANPACTGTNFTLSLQNPPSELGVNYQWQTSPDGVTWANAGPNAPTFTTSQTAITWYQCIVTCVPTSQSATSTPIQVTMNSFLNCYCTPTHTFGTSGCFYGVVNNVTLNTLNHNPTCLSTSPYYFNNPPVGAATTNLVGGTSYTLSITSGYYNGVGVWIDYNQSGTFDASEYINISGNNNSSGSTWTGTATVNVPLSVVSGQTKMRINTEYYCCYTLLDANAACSAFSYGETEDYTVTLIAPGNCAGNPAASTTLSSAAASCGSQAFTLSLSDPYTDAGLSFDWQSSPDNVTWASTGGTGHSYSTSQAATTWYRCIITCSNGGATTTSTPIQVTVNSDFCSCATYCTSSASSTADEEIYNVTINGASTPAAYAGSGGCGVTAPGPGSIAYRYSNFRSLGSLTTVQQGQNVTFSIDENECDGATFYSCGIAIWIDLNQNGSFDDAGEQVFVEPSTAAGPRTASGSFTIPIGALTGTTAVRVTAAEGYSGTGLTSCLAYGYGETEDYCISIVAAVPCAGTPSPGNTNSSVPAACASQSFTLSLQNNPLVTGLSYQWQTSPDGVTWANGGPNASTWTLNQTVATWYQCIVTCVNGGASATSTPVQVTQTVCYCATPLYSYNPSYGCTANDFIGNFTFAGINNTTGCNAGTPPYYTYYGAQTAVVDQTGAYPVTISATAGLAYFQRFKVYIDFNDNGSLDDAGEMVYDSGPISTSTNYASGTISIPPTAALGTHRLRVRSHNGLNTNLDANSCSDDGYIGEVEDYNITINPAPVCSGTPTPGQTLASTPLACASTSINLSLQTATPGTGVTYQWQSASDFAFTSPVDLGTSATQSTTELATYYYRCLVTCSGNTGISTPVKVTYSVPCYCTTPVTGSNGCGLGLYINNLTFAGINNTSGCYNPVPYTSPYYDYFADQTATVQQNQSYPLTITTPNNAGGYYQSFGVWIDMNDNGSFEDAGEKVMASAAFNSTTTNTLTGSLLIPLSAPAGTHLMRIRSGNVDGSSVILNSCSVSSVSGETEDYNITITAAPACSGTPNPGNTLSTLASVCPGQSFTISLQNYPTNESGISYVWQWSDDGGVTWPPVPGIGNVASFSYTQGSFWEYRCVVTCSASGQSAISVPVLVNENPATQCYCPAGANTNGCNTGDEYLSNFQLNTINNSSTCPPSNMYSDFTSITTNLTPGQGYSASVLNPNWFGGDQATVWIDFNQNGSFSDAGEQFDLLDGGGDGTTPLTGTVTVPMSAAGGTTGMRVRLNYTGLMDPCGMNSYGEVEDYRVVIGDPNCVLAPIYPGNNSVICPDPALALSWPSNAGATGYDVYFDAVNPPTTLVSANQAGTSYIPPSVSSTLTYYWKVVPQYSLGSCTTPAVFTFSFKPAPDPSANSNAPICEGNPLGLTSSNNASGQSSGNAYSWTGPGFTSSSQNPSVTGSATPSQSGTYIVTITNAFGCTSTASTLVAVNANPTGTAAVTGVSCVGLCDGGVVITPTAGQYPYIFTDGVTVNTDGIFTNAYCEGPASVDVFDDNGCTATIPFSVGHISSAPPNINVAFPTVPAYGCSGTIGTATTNPVNLATTYTWDGPTGTTFNSGGNPFATSTPSVTVHFGAPNGSGYNICVQAGNGCGSTNRRCNFVRGTVNVPGVITPANNRTVECASTSANYSIAAVTGATGYTWTSSNPNATVVGSGTSATVTFGAGWTGPMTTTLSVTANTPCFSSAPRSLTLSTSSAAPGAISGSATACPGSSITYSVPVAAGAATYNWVLPANTTGSSTSNSILVNFLPGFTFGDIKISITSICGVTSAQLNKTINSGLPAMPASISGNLGGLCGQTVTYSCPSVSGASTYTWTTPGTINSGQNSTSINVTYGSFVNGTVCVKANNACGSGAQRCVPVQGAPVAPGTISYSPNPVCANASGVDLQVAPVFGVTTYNWTFPAGVTPVLNLGNEQIVNWGPTGGVVTVTVNNACGSASKNQTISLGCREIAPAEATVSDEVTVYPNPAHNNVTVQFNATEKTNYVLNLTDLSGRVITTTNATAQRGMNTSNLDLSQVAKGVYMIEVKSDLMNKQIRVVVE